MVSISTLQGLIDKFFENQPSMKLVSDGCECFAIRKDIYLEHADDELLNAVANTVSIQSVSLSGIKNSGKEVIRTIYFRIIARGIPIQ